MKTRPSPFALVDDDWNPPPPRGLSAEQIARYGQRVEQKKHRGVVLTPIPWGKPDPALARAVCWHIRDAMPDTVIPFNPKTHRKLRVYLREHGFTH